MKGLFEKAEAAEKARDRLLGLIKGSRTSCEDLYTAGMDLIEREEEFMKELDRFLDYVKAG